MAISNILPRKIMKNRTRQQSMAERHDYDQKEEKTDGGRLVSSYMCSPETAAEEFEISKKLYEKLTGRSQPVKRDIIMYRMIQSFKPDEISPEDAHKLGCELAMRFTGGQHQFVVATHVDKRHIHTHIEFNSVNLNCDAKFQNVKNSAFILRRMNDELCRAYGLSVIENPKKKAKSQKETAAAQYGVSHKKQLQQMIDQVLPGCHSYEEFLAKMRAGGYEVTDGKNPGFRLPGWERPTRVNRMGEDYTRAALCARITGQSGRSAAGKAASERNDRKVHRLIDIQAKLDAGKGAGYERWAKIFNLKEAAETLNFLMEHGITDYGELTSRAEAAGEKFDSLSARIKQIEGRMSKIAQLKMHIFNYTNTRDIYKEYQKSRSKEAYRAAHAEEIKKHEAAKKAFDVFGGRPIPKISELTARYETLLAEKKACYGEYRTARKEMIEYQTARQNVDKILGMEVHKKGQKEAER